MVILRTKLSRLVVVWTCVALTLMTTLIANPVSATKDSSSSSSISIQTFVQNAIAGVDHNNNVSQSNEQTMWVISESKWGNELLFVVDNVVDQRVNVVSNQKDLCGCRSRNEHEPCNDNSQNSLAVVGIIGYIRPGHISRFCLWEDGRVDSFQSRRVLQVTKVAPAPTLSQLVHQIQDQGPAQTCLPGCHRGLLFETMELLCFALGHKPAVVRQRQQQTGTGDSKVSILNGVPANLFVPHTKVLWTWLLQQPHEHVWRGLSQVTWGSDQETNPPFEHSVILARDPELGRRLVDWRVQDISIPHQVDDVAMARYIVQVGHALGYPEPQVRMYLEKELDGFSENLPRDEIEHAIRRAFDDDTTLHDSDGNNMMDCHIQEGEGACQSRNQPYPELPGFREFLESKDAQELSSKPMREVVEPLDSFFFH